MKIITSPENASEVYLSDNRKFKSVVELVSWYRCVLLSFVDTGALFIVVDVVGSIFISLQPSLFERKL